MTTHPTTLAAATRLLDGGPIRITRKLNEYRVTYTDAALVAEFGPMTLAEHREKAEALASYTTDLADAFDTAQAMARTHLANLPRAPRTAPAPAPTRQPFPALPFANASQVYNAENLARALAIKPTEIETIRRVTSSRDEYPVQLARLLNIISDLYSDRATGA
jgi:hypothetical protein